MIIQKINQLKSRKFDLLIIGGGITGAGIALDAASRGLSVALIDKGDFASGTSSKSTKLIHGGLRYLKQLEFGLVKQVGHERDIAYRNAIHLVRPQKMLLPIYDWGSMNLVAASIAVYIYDWLAGVKSSERRKVLSAKQALKYEPTLPEKGLKGAVLYTEYVTDDARLTIEILKKAEELGAICLNYCEALEPIFTKNEIQGIRVRFKITDEEFLIYANAVINAAGPWTDEVRKKAEPISGKKLVLSKGVHLVFDRMKIPVAGPMYIDVKKDSGRMIFLIPRENSVYAGTTDTIYSGNPDDSVVSKADAAYILTAINDYFENIHLIESDILSSWAGFRPLIGEPGKKTSEISRKDEIFVTQNGLISIAGGKLTGYRVMAEKAIKKLSDLKGLNLPPPKTKNIQLSGAQFESEKELHLFIEKCIDECRQLPVKAHEVMSLAHRYGSNASEIIEKAYDIFNTNRLHPNPLLEAEVMYSIEKEFALKPADFFIRRSGMLYFSIRQIETVKKQVFEYFSKYSGFDTFTCALHAGEFEEELINAARFE
jgi:glycerol-3-phosphate dehydrogenase